MLKNRSAVRLGERSIVRLVLSLAIPSMLAQFVNVAYGIVDRIYIGNLQGIGEVALGGVGVCGPLTTIISSFAYLVGLGGAPLVAIRLGEGDGGGAKRILANAFVMLIGISVVLTAIVALFGDTFLRWFGATGDLFPYASDYLYVYNTGTFFALMAAGLNCFIIAQGRAGLGMLTSVIGAVSNIALDPLFIFTFGMGVKGAALATVLSQLFSALFALCVLFFRKDMVRISFGSYNGKSILKILALGVSPFLIIATDSVMLLALNSVLASYGGQQAGIYISASTIMLSFMQVVTLPLGGITSGTQPLLGFNYGAGKIDRVKKGETVIVVCSLIYTTVMFVFARLGAGLFVALFNASGQLARLSVEFIAIYTSMIIPLALQYAFVDGLTGLGIARIAVVLSMLRKIAVMLPLTFIFPLFLGAEGALYAEPVADALSAVVSTVVYLVTINKILEKRKNALLQSGRTL